MLQKRLAKTTTLNEFCLYSLRINELQGVVIIFIKREENYLNKMQIMEIIVLGIDKRKNILRNLVADTLGSVYNSAL